MVKQPKYRWAVISAYAAAMAVTHMLWLNLAPLSSMVQLKYGVSDLAISSLLLAFPLSYILLAMHSGALVDRRGYRQSILLGLMLTAIFATVRAFELSFPVLLVAQIGIAVGQPYIVTAVSKLVADCFPEDERALASGIAVGGVFIGMALGLGVTPILVEWHGFHVAMAMFAGVSILVAIIVPVVIRGGTTASANASVTKSAPALHPLALLKNHAVAKMAAAWFLAFGSFNGLTTWLEPILQQGGITSKEAGLGGAAIIVGGIAGSFLLTALADHLRLRRFMMILSCVSAVALLLPLCSSTSLSTLTILGGLFGFMFLPGYPLVLAVSEKVAGEPAAGAAVSLLMLAGNAGAVVAIACMPLVNSHVNDWANSIYLLLLFLAVTVVILLRMPKNAFDLSSSAAHI